MYAEEAFEHHEKNRPNSEIGFYAIRNESLQKSISVQIQGQRRFKPT